MNRRRDLILCTLLCPALPAMAQTRPFRIYMILYRGETAVEKGFRDYLAQHKLPVELIVRNIAQDTQQIPKLVDEARSMNVDLIYTWGTPITLAVVGNYKERSAQQHVTDIPILFTMVSSPEASGLVISRNAPGRNFTGVVHVVPLEQQLGAIRAYLPLRRMAVIYNPAEINSRLNVNELHRAAAHDKFELIELAIPLDSHGKPIAATLPALVNEIARQKPDVLYLRPDTFIAANRKVFTAAALEARLPIFAATEVALRDGQALFGLVSRYENVGQLAGRKAEQILIEKRAPQDLPIDTLVRFSYVVNMTVAKKLDLYPPLKVANYAEIIH